MIDICSCFRAIGIGLALAPIARAGEAPLDAELAVGQSFEGRIAMPSDVDRVTVGLLKGARAMIQVHAAPGSLVEPRVELRRDGVPVALKGAVQKLVDGGHGHKLKHVPIPAEGVYEILVRGDGKKLGDYRLEIDEVLPGSVTKKLAVEAGATGLVTFAARAGAELTLTLRRKSKHGDPLGLPVVRAPSGDPVDLDGLVESVQDGRVLIVGPVALDEEGEYRIEVSAPATEPQVIKANVELAHAEPAPVAAATEPLGHATVSGGVDLGDGYWLDGEGESDADADAYADAMEDEVLVRVRSGADGDAVAAALGGVVWGRAPGGWLRVRLASAGLLRLASDLPSRRRTRELVTAARRRPDVLLAEANHVRTSFSPPTDPLFLYQWDFAMAGFDDAWAVEAGDASRVVAVLDTGIRSEHPDLAGRLVGGYDFVGDAWNGGDGNGIDPDPTDMWLQQGTHGTHVTGTIAAGVDNGVGIAGGALNVKVMPIRVLGLLGGTDFDIAQGILYASRLPNSSGKLPATRADVINMSLGGPSFSEIMYAAIRDAVDAGVVVVAAAGNYNSSNPLYPAAYPEVIAVAATDLADERAYYSSFGDHVDIAAPGGDKNADLDHDGLPDSVLSTVVDPYVGPTYDRKSGTSMAAPHVAAAAFLLRSIDPTYTPAVVEAYLGAGAIDLGEPGPDAYFGIGRVDAGRSLQVAIGAGTGDPSPFFGPHLVDFGSRSLVRQFGVVNRGGGGVISIQSVTTDSFWLEVTSNSSVTPATIELVATRDGLAAGLYETDVLVQTSAGSFTVPARMTIQPDGPIGVKEVIVVAVDVITGDPVRFQKVTEETADDFLLDPLPEGTYRVFASTDLDFDGVVGEAHDYTGQLLDDAAGTPKLVLGDGTSLVGGTITLVEGKSKQLPGQGSIYIEGIHE